MWLRGAFKNGVIIPEKDVDLPSGTIVEFRLCRAGNRKPTSKRNPKNRKARARAGLDHLLNLKFVGMWKNRKQWRGKSSIQIARELRRRAMGSIRRP